MTTGPSSRDYYDKYPAVENTPGDIWVDLPTFGLFPTAYLPGLVVTPACDLANRKVETITYLPIIPVRSWFSTVAAFPEIRRLTDGQWDSLNKGSLLGWPPGFCLPSVEQLTAVEKRISEVESVVAGAKEKNAARRTNAGIRLIKLIAATDITDAADSDLRGLYGPKEWPKTVERVTRNAFRSDLHFLPADDQSSEWSGVRTHSLVLFRYPITVPLEILEAAQDLTLGDWGVSLSAFEKTFPIATAFKAKRPMKRVTLKPPFISDLLSRYLGMNFRLGSPDFTNDAIERMCKEIQTS